MSEAESQNDENPASDAAAGEQTENFDVLIVGAGLSGIAAAYHLQGKCPAKRFAILEGRDVIGGTWDLFRYPGVRSDSDMHTLGYSFRPWLGEKSITGGDSILEYIQQTAEEHRINAKIRFKQQVTRASWSSADALWTVEAAVGPQRKPVRYTCNFLYMCSGYYDFAEGYWPQWPHADRFAGRIVHPQHWPDDLDYAGRRVVVIGSGATAVTLVPEMARTAAHVTMLQRSPTYIVPRPAEDAVANWLNRKLPAKLAHALTRWKNVLFGIYFYQYARRKPELTKQKILGLTRKYLGPDYDIGTHFTPSYNPWDQRLCLIPDADLFAAIRKGRVSVVTDHIECFTPAGLMLRSGAVLDADIVVAATGLKVQLMGGMQVVVDGVPANLGQAMSYKGMMYSDVPNLASAFGYANASWTLRSELTSRYVCRLLRYMDRHGFAHGTPRRRDLSIGEDPVLPLTSGYVQRARGILPKQGARNPWRMHQNYALDLAALKFSPVADGAMEFTRRRERCRAA